MSLKNKNPKDLCEYFNKTTRKCTAPPYCPNQNGVCCIDCERNKSCYVENTAICTEVRIYMSKIPLIRKLYDCMKVKTYAYFDAIGVREEIINKRSSNVLNGFLKTLYAWASTAHDKGWFMQLENEHSIKAPNVIISSFSDSAILETEEEYTLKDFYNLAIDLKEAIEKSIKVYCIINRDIRIWGDEGTHWGGETMVQEGVRPRFIKTIEAGPVWHDIYKASIEIEKKEEWHEKYSLYCVHEENASGYKIADSIEICGLFKKVKVCALIK